MSIPPRVLHAVAFHARTITAFNAAVADTQRMGALFGSPGRYEWEYRSRHEPEAEAALAALAAIEALAATNAVALEDLYAHCGGRPQKTPWSVAAQSWQQPA